MVAAPYGITGNRLRLPSDRARSPHGTVTEGPQEYPHYVPGYYAVFFTDPEGIKLEFVHIPG